MALIHIGLTASDSWQNFSNILYTNLIYFPIWIKIATQRSAAQTPYWLVLAYHLNICYYFNWCLCHLASFQSRNCSDRRYVLRHATFHAKFICLQYNNNNNFRCFHKSIATQHCPNPTANFTILHVSAKIKQTPCDKIKHRWQIKRGLYPSPSNASNCVSIFLKSPKLFRIRLIFMFFNYGYVYRFDSCDPFIVCVVRNSHITVIIQF